MRTARHVTRQAGQRAVSTGATSRLHTVPVRSAPPVTSQEPLSVAAAREHILAQMTQHTSLLESPIDIRNAGKTLGLLSKAHVETMGIVKIKDREYRALLRGERTLPDIQGDTLETGMRELSRNISVTDDPEIAQNFSNFIHSSTMTELQKQKYCSEKSLREHIDNAVSRIGVILVPTTMPLVEIPTKMAQQFDLPIERESVLSKGMVVEVGEGLPEGVTLPEILRQDYQQKDFFHVRCLTPEEEDAEREKARAREEELKTRSAPLE